MRSGKAWLFRIRRPSDHSCRPGGVARPRHWTELRRSRCLWVGAAFRNANGVTQATADTAPVIIGRGRVGPDWNDWGPQFCQLRRSPALRNARASFMVAWSTSLCSRPRCSLRLGGTGIETRACIVPPLVDGGRCAASARPVAGMALPRSSLAEGPRVLSSSSDEARVCERRASAGSDSTWN